MTRRKTDGEKVANATKGLDVVGTHYLAIRIDRIIQRRMAEAWDIGWKQYFAYGKLALNPYRRRKWK